MAFVPRNTTRFCLVTISAQTCKQVCRWVAMTNILHPQGSFLDGGQMIKFIPQWIVAQNQTIQMDWCCAMDWHRSTGIPLEYAKLSRINRNQGSLVGNQQVYCSKKAVWQLLSKLLVRQMEESTERATQLKPCCGGADREKPGKGTVLRLREPGFSLRHTALTGELWTSYLIALELFPYLVKQREENKLLL